MSTKVYAVRLKNKNEVLKSSSGGAFTAISDYFLLIGGAVVSAIYNYETHQNEFILYTTKEQRDKARGSKYMQAFPLNSFKEAERWIKEHDKELLFVGTGCQADGFRKFAELKGFRDRTTIVDIVCHGVPAPVIWKNYIKSFDANYDNLTFRDKRNGWHYPTAILKVNGKEKNIQDYLAIFYSKCALRDSCYECPYATIERKVDFTIGDFWGIETALPNFDVGDGVSLVLIHSKKGQNLFEKIKNDIEWCESNTTDCLQPNLIKPTEKSPRREEFWRDYQKGGIKKVINKYVKGPVWIRVLRNVKRLIKKKIAE